MPVQKVPQNTPGAKRPRWAPAAALARKRRFAALHRAPAVFTGDYVVRRKISRRSRRTARFLPIKQYPLTSPAGPRRERTISVSADGRWFFPFKMQSWSQADGSSAPSFGPSLGFAQRQVRRFSTAYSRQAEPVERHAGRGTLLSQWLRSLGPIHDSREARGSSPQGWRFFRPLFGVKERPRAGARNSPGGPGRR